MQVVIAHHARFARSQELNKMIRNLTWHVVVAGGTGFVGRALVRRLAELGERVTVLSRRAGASPVPGIEVVQWDPAAPAPALFAGKDAVVNLAGEPIETGRWTAERKQQILDSRVLTTRGLVNALAAAGPERPRVLVNASAVGYYGPRGDEALDEEAPAGNDFLAQVCVAWEGEAQAAEALGVRVVRARLGMVLGSEGGILAKFLPAFRRGVAGRLGSGQQWFSWVHIDDVVAALVLALQQDTLHGPVNVTSPNPVTNRELTEVLGRVLNRPTALPMPASVVRLRLGEMASPLLTGQRVLPVRLLQLGFQHRFPDLEMVLRDIINRES